MPNYLVNKNAQPTGEHEVHTTTCSHLPDYLNQDHLGFHNNCHEAVAVARVLGYSNVDGCYYCCNDCHTR